jgi:hypothetical protein
MSLKEKLTKSYANAYLTKYGDRLTQLQGNILSVKITSKTILLIFNKLSVDMVVKPQGSKAIVKCKYKKNRWFKKPTFIQLTQGNLVVVQGLKPKKNKKKENTSEAIEVLNIRNLTTKKDLIPVDQKVQRVQQRQFIK